MTDIQSDSLFPSGTQPSGINSSGMVVGQGWGTNNTYHIFLYAGGRMVDLGPGWASAINDSGQIVGSGTTEAFLYSNGKMVPLGVPAGANGSEANAINSTGTMIAGSAGSILFSSDAFHMTTPLPTGKSCIRAMRNALEFAKVNPEQIDYINAQASSTQLNDANEASCIQATFNGQAKKVPVSGTKAHYGHPLGASAAIEGVICALAIRDSLVPPTLNYQTPDPICDLDVVPNEPREKEVNYVLSNAFGFGGINS